MASMTNKRDNDYTHIYFEVQLSTKKHTIAPTHSNEIQEGVHLEEKEGGRGGGGLWLASLNLNTDLNCGDQRSSPKHQYSRHLNALPTCIQIKKRYGAPISIHHNNSQYHLVNHVDS
jgi:hypothetical protein